MGRYNGTYRLDKVTIEEPVSETQGIFLMNVDLFKGGNTITLPYIGNLAEAQAMIGYDVDIITQKNIIKGVATEVIANLTVIQKIATIDKTENIKLYSTDAEPLESSIAFKNIQMGETIKDVILYCQNITFDSSSKAKWANLKMLDQERHAAIVKLFEYETQTTCLEGKYVKLDIKRTEYGFNAVSDIEECTDIAAPANPDIEIARNYLISIMSQDNKLFDFVRSKGLLEALQKYAIEEVAETGYMLVRLAMEVDLAMEMVNISPMVDVKTLIRGLFLRKAYTINQTSKSTQSKFMMNTLWLLQSPFAGDKKVLNIIDENPPAETLERMLADNLTTMVDAIVRRTKTGEQYIDIDSRWGKRVE